MEIRFSFEELEIQKSVRKFVKNDLLPISREVDDKWALPDRVREKLLSMGILKTAFPEEWGGVGGTFTGMIIALKELSYASVVPSWLLFENFMFFPYAHRLCLNHFVSIFPAGPGFGKSQEHLL